MVGPICITICNPLWTLKSVYIVSEHKDNIYQHAKRLFRTNGYMGFQKGLLMGYANCINGTITFTLYDIFKDIANTECYANFGNKDVKTFLCSACAKVCAYLVSFPIFACRIQHQIQQKSLWCAISFVFGNPLKIYSGLSATLMQAIPKNSLLFWLNENINKLMD